MQRSDPVPVWLVYLSRKKSYDRGKSGRMDCGKNQEIEDNQRSCMAINE